MPPIHSLTGRFSSGDAIADRRADYARMLADGGDYHAAAELMEQALEIVREWAAGWFQLGEYRQKALRTDAAEAYRRTLELAPEDIFGAGLKLALLKGGAPPDKAPSRYVEGLFDNYADRFDNSLVGKLGYNVPAKLAALVIPHGPFKNVVDIGCGTGLFGEEIRAHTKWLEGFDLSGNMLAKAKAKKLYDHLAISDLNLDASDSGLFGESGPEQRCNLVSAADVLTYLGSLTPVMVSVKELLVPGGLFAFSVEAVDRGYVLRDTLRYGHSNDYVQSQLKHNGFETLASVETVLRMDAGKPIDGLLFLTRKTG